MDTWSPIFSSLVASSLWGEAKHVRLVFITMLALKDKSGLVAGSIPGLARLAVVTLDECREALEVLESPDVESKCKDHDGRRIQTVAGGWVVLGHARFQALMRDVSAKIGNAKRQQKYRNKATTTLRGEGEYHEADRGGATEGQLDNIVTKHLP